MQPKYQYSIQDMRVGVYDDLMPRDQINSLFKFLCDAPYQLHETPKPSHPDTRHWSVDVPVNDAKTWSLYTYASSLLPAVVESKEYVLNRAYCNLATFGDVLLSHRDCHPPLRVVTALWYVCPEWHVDWAGETIFFSDDGDAQVAITPRPGRLVLADGRIHHSGRPPSRVSPIPRLTFALKFIAAA